MPSLQFVLGPASADHQQVMLDQLAEAMAAHPHDQFFYLVPNHIKFSTEIDVLSRLKARQGGGVYAQNRLQILSFSRLAWFLLKNDPRFNAPRVSPTGMTMMVAAIVKDLSAAELGMFAKEARQPGFIQDLTKQMVELRNANLAPDDYANFKAALTAQRPTLANKLDVLFLIYQRFCDRLGSQLETPAIYDLLIEVLDQGDFAHTHFFIDRFNANLAAKEERLVEAMIQNGAATTVSLVLDRPYRNRQLPNPNDLYAQPGTIYSRLTTFATAVGVPQLPDLPANQARVAPAIAAVEQWFRATSNFGQPQPPQLTPADQTAFPIHFFTAPSREGELNLVAAKIRQLVATGDYRYRDFLVLSRRLDGYEPLLAPTFAAHGVPVFNDNDRPMKTHPLATLVNGLLELALGRFTLEDLMLVLKTGLLKPQKTFQKQPLTMSRYREILYRTENWCLKYGKTGIGAWNSEKRFEYLLNPATPAMKELNEERSAELNLIKRFVKGKLLKLRAALRTAASGRELAATLYGFLSENGVPDRLAEWETAAESRGDLSLAQEPQQVWHLLCQLLDEYVQMFGADTFPAAGSQVAGLRTFADLLSVGFEAATYSQVPSTLDQVLVSESGITQTENRRVVFILGATDDVMPAPASDDGLLTEDDRQALNQLLAPGQYLPLSGLAQAAGEPFVNCLAMLTAKERLYLSAPLNAGDEGTVALSPYIPALQAYFGAAGIDLPVANYPLVPGPGADFSQIQPFLSSPTATRTSLIKVRRLRQEAGGDFGPSWRKVLDQVNRILPADRRVTADYHYRNNPQALTPELAEALYGTVDPAEIAQGRVANPHSTLQASISKLQTYYKNPYEFFLQYGLRLQKRPEFEIANSDSGTFYHKVMESFVKATMAKKEKLADLKRATVAQRTEAALKEATAAQPLLADLAPVLADPTNAANTELRRFSYQLHHLRQVAKVMTQTLVDQAHHSQAQPIKVEEVFHLALPTPLDDGHRVELTGKLDRLDEVVLADQAYQLVVDYKSSQHQFDLVRAYHGIDLQLLTYLLAVQDNPANRDAALAGALYLQLLDPALGAKEVQSDRTISNLKAHRYNGLLVSDGTGDLFKALDDTLAMEKNWRGIVLPVNLPKAGPKAAGGGTLVTPAELGWLLDHNLDLIRQAASQIFAGDNRLAPYRIKEDQRATGQAFTDFAPVFAFDPLLDQDHYRAIEGPLADANYLKKLIDQALEAEGK